MNNRTWLERLKTLLGRLPYHGLDSSIAASSLIAGWGIYSSLSRMGG